MPDKILGATADVFQRGQFSSTEADKLRNELATLNIIAQLDSVPQDQQAQPCYALGRQAIQAFSNYFSADRNAKAIKSSVRVIACYVDQGKKVGCNASAFSAQYLLGNQQPTYVIRMNIHGLPILLDRAQAVLGALGGGAVEQLPGDDANLSTKYCAFVAMLIVFFHEMGHVLRGHLEWDSPITGECWTLTPENRQLRRTLETDADTFAAHMLGTFLKGYSQTMQVRDGLDAQLSWFFCGLVGSYTVFCTLAEDGSRSNTCYHSPIVRLHAICTHLGINMDLKKDYANRLFGAFLAEMLESYEKNRELLHELEFETATYIQDDNELRTITHPMLTNLNKQDRLHGWVS